jgi:hypothetical protein
MITYDVNKQIGNEAELAFKGLAADTKPTGTYDGYDLMNGSSFFEMDTQNVKFYDAENDVWV